mgnify:FL=1|jgi:type IV pilus assembly protein PilB
MNKRFDLLREKGQWDFFDKIIQENSISIDYIRGIDDIKEKYTLTKESITPEEIHHFKKFAILPAYDTINQENVIIVTSIMRRMKKDIHGKFFNKRVIMIPDNDFIASFDFLFPDENKLSLDIELNDSNLKTSSIITSILNKAYRLEASDIHFNWRKDNVCIRYRVAGHLLSEQEDSIPLDIAENVRIGLINKTSKEVYNIQTINAKFSTKIANKDQEYRLSVMKSVSGFSIVIRHLHDVSTNETLEDIGFMEKPTSIIRDIINENRYGMFLFTGPTGSGKTTALYTVIHEIDTTKDLAIKTIEDPVEIYYEGIDQVSVNTQGEKENHVTYTSAIIEFLRQDPDIILIGELRGESEVQQAGRASLTGHFVLSTLHTNDVESTILRLFDLNMAKDIVEDTLCGIASLNLIPKLCDCKIKVGKTKKFKMNINGCEKCVPFGYPGYHGRVPIIEVARTKFMLDNFKKENFKDYYSKEDNLKELYDKGIIDKLLLDRYSEKKGD